MIFIYNDIYTLCITQWHYGGVNHPIAITGRDGRLIVGRHWVVKWNSITCGENLLNVIYLWIFFLPNPIDWDCDLWGLHWPLPQWMGLLEGSRNCRSPRSLERCCCRCRCCCCTRWPGRQRALRNCPVPEECLFISRKEKTGDLKLIIVNFLPGRPQCKWKPGQLLAIRKIHLIISVIGFCLRPTQYT